MKRIFIFDTETTGFLNQGSELVQFAGHVMGWDGKRATTLMELSTLVKHEKESPPAALNIHGITKNLAEHGITAKACAQWYINQLTKADIVVAHNLAFDAPLMKEVIVREGLAIPAINKQTICTMKVTTPLCKIPKPNGREGYKWPKLEEALAILCDHSITDAHDALGDVRSTRILLLKLLELGHVKL